MTMVPLGEICAFVYGKGLPKSQREEGRFPVYGSNGVVGTHTNPLSDSETIIIGRKGSIGELHYSPTPCWPIDTTYFVDRTSTSEDMRWLFHALHTLRLPELNKATGVPGLNRNDAYERKIFLPDRDEQRRIASILDKADDVRRKHARSLSLADDLMKATFLDMFGDPNGHAARYPHAAIKDFGRVVTGNTPPREDARNYGDFIEWIKSDNINTPYHYITASVEGLSEEGLRKARTVPAGATLVTCIAGSPDCIGNAALTDRKVAFNQQINAIVPFEHTDPYFFYAQVVVAKPLIQRASTNSMKGMVSKGRFEEIQFLKPPSERQRAFGIWFKNFLKLNAVSELALRESEAQLGSLSQRAFRGEL